MPLENVFGALALDATVGELLAEFRNRWDVVKTAKATYAAPGTRALVIPPAGQRLRPVWFYAQAKGALDTGFVIVGFALGANAYEVELTGSQPFAHGAVWEGGVNEQLTVTTSSAAEVMVNVDWRSFA